MSRKIRVPVWEIWLPVWKNKASCLGNNMSWLGNKTSCLGNKTSCLRNKTSCLGNKTSCLGNKTSCLGNKTSCLGNKTPCLGNKTSCLGNKTSCLGNKTSYSIVNIFLVFFSFQKQKSRAQRTNNLETIEDMNFAATNEWDTPTGTLPWLTPKPTSQQPTDTMANSPITFLPSLNKKTNWTAAANNLNGKSSYTTQETWNTCIVT